MNATIYKFSFLLNGRVAVSALAKTYEEALSRVKTLFGKNDEYELIAKTFSHNTGDYSIVGRKDRVEAKKSVSDYHEDSADDSDLMANVMSAYARDKKVTL